MQHLPTFHYLSKVWLWHVFWNFTSFCHVVIVVIDK
jgi:hypothetical protein